MVKNFLLSMIRKIRKQPGYILLNVGGLTVGLVSFFFIALYVIHELSYDRFHKNYENIYRIKIVGRLAGGVLDQAVSSAPMAQTILRDYPEVLQVTRARRLGDWLVKSGDKKFNEGGVLFADSTFFDVLDFRLLKGDAKTALVRPKSVVLSEEYAKKYFGDQDPMDQRLRFESDTNLFTVTGVVEDVPDVSHIKFDMVASISTYPGMGNNPFWLSNNFYTYILVRDGTDQAKLQEKFLDMIMKYVGPQLKEITGQTIDDFRNAGNEFRFVLEPLKDLHLKGATQYNLEPPGSSTTVYIFIVIGILILVVAVINYINLATARSAARAKEIGVRKVSGAGRTGLMVQFLAESLATTVVAALIALLLTYILGPAFNQLTGMKVSLSLINNLPGIASVIILVIFIGIASGLYPAFVLASYNPAEVLKGTLSPGSMSKRLRWLLVVFQFTVSIVIIIGSIIVYSQLNFVTRKDIGFDKENLLIIRRVDAFWQQMEAFRSRVLEIPGVVSAGFARSVPGTDFNNNAFFNDNDPEKNTYLINQTAVSLDFPQVLGVRLAEGRFFSKEFGTDSAAILINEATVKELGLKDPVGKYILQPTGPGQWQRLQVVGVMRDFNIASFHKAIPPVCFTVSTGGGGDMFGAIRISGKDVTGIIREIGKVWQEFTRDMPFQYDFFTDRWNNLYAAEMKTGKLFLIFSFLAVFIACMGLIGLITYITNKRTREIGIRKSYGASNRVVLALLSKEVVYLIILSSVAAYPVAFFGSRLWLEGFASRVSVSPLVYMLATVVTLAVGWISISYQTIKAANYNPASALRLE
ncbi:MAG: ABC transporter permease [Bacteroidales bacterium]